MDKTTYGEKMYLRRKTYLKIGSLKKMGSIIGLSAVMLSLFERGALKRPSINTIRKIAAGYKVKDMEIIDVYFPTDEQKKERERVKKEWEEMFKKLEADPGIKEVINVADIKNENIEIESMKLIVYLAKKADKK